MLVNDIANFSIRTLNSMAFLLVVTILLGRKTRNIYGIFIWVMCLYSICPSSHSKCSNIKRDLDTIFSTPLFSYLMRILKYPFIFFYVSSSYMHCILSCGLLLQMQPSFFLGLISFHPCLMFISFQRVYKGKWNILSLHCLSV